MVIEKISHDKMYSSEEVSDLLFVSLRTTQRLLKSGDLSSYRINGQYRIKGLDILNYLESVKKESDSNSQNGKPIDYIKYLDITPITIDLGVGLAKIISSNFEKKFYNLLNELRKEIAIDLGFIISGVKINDNTNLDNNDYIILVNGLKVKKAVIDLKNDKSPLETIIKTLNLIIRKYAHEILSRDEVFLILEKVRVRHSILVDEVIADDPYSSEKITVGQLTKVLRELLRENVSIRNIPMILEVLADNVPHTKSFDILVEKVREGLSGQICAKLADEEWVIEFISVSEHLEKEIDKVFNNQKSSYKSLEPNIIRNLDNKLKLFLKDHQKCRTIICSPKIRKNLQMILDRNFMVYQVLSFKEIHRDFKVSLVDELGL